MIKKLLLLVLPSTLFAQGYTSYFTGNATNIETTPEYGVCMMGGATEHDNAMIWLLEKANGGDVVVLRSSGSDGYNDYMYSGLGVTINSVETFVITSVAGATNPYVLDKVAKAELIWFAGGDQWNYVSYFKNNALEDLLNQHINVKQAPIGGTSAGMAILGGKYFSAQNGSVTSEEALSNPFNPYMTVMAGDFLDIPYLSGAITDTHYDDPDRRGRHTAFLARLSPFFISPKGIACNEYVAVCVDAAGKATVYGDYPNYQEFAYFIAPNCENPANPETLEANTPLTWNNNGEALKVYKVPGTMNGSHYFNLSSWELPVASGGSWEHWSVVDGVLNVTVGDAPNCILSVPDDSRETVNIGPNPFKDAISIRNAAPGKVLIFDLSGKKVMETGVADEIPVSSLVRGMYLVKIESGGKTVSKKLVKI